MQLGKLGVWYPMDRLDAAGIRGRCSGRWSSMGYSALWYPESRGYESLSLAGFMLGNTTDLTIGSSIASIYARDAFTVAARDDRAERSLYGSGASSLDSA